MANNSLTCRACSRNNVNDSGREVRFLYDFRQFQRGEWCAFGRFDYNCVACGECGSDFPSRHKQWEIPRNNLSGNSEGTYFPPRESVRELVRPTCVIKKVRGYEGEVYVTGFPDWFTTVQGFRNGQFARSFLNNPSDAKKVFASFRRSKS